MTGQELRKLAARADEEWKGDPNVVGVGLGIKKRRGEWVPGPNLCFTVRKKLATVDEIVAAGSRPIPPTYQGVSTDVTVVESVLLQGLPFPVGSRGTERQSPIVGGTSTSALSSRTNRPTGFGTLGSVCIHVPTERSMALSNAHVWGSTIGTEIVQPFLPVGEFLEGAVKLLACGPTISFLEAKKWPSGLTLALSAASGASWLAAVAADAKDPHRRGQEATSPARSDERTLVEHVRFEAQPKDLPLPGTHFEAEVSWQYVRQTEEASYSYSVQETRINEQTLVRSHVWAQPDKLTRGGEVQILALLETARADRPDAYHVVAHLTPDRQPERRISRILHPSTCGRVPFLCTYPPQGQPDSPAQFPLEHGGLTYRSRRAGRFRDRWPARKPDGVAELEFSAPGLEIDTPASSRAEIHVASPDADPIALEAFDRTGALLDRTSSPTSPEDKYVLAVQGSTITRLVLQGGGGKGLLLFICLRVITPVSPEPLRRGHRIFCYHARHTVDPREASGAWRALLSAQSVNTTAPGTPPAEAAETVGGVENVQTVAAPLECHIIMELDNVYDLI